LFRDYFGSSTESKHTHEHIVSSREKHDQSDDESGRGQKRT